MSWVIQMSIPVLSYDFFVCLNDVMQCSLIGIYIIQGAAAPLLGLEEGSCFIRCMIGNHLGGGIWT